MSGKTNSPQTKHLCGLQANNKTFLNTHFKKIFGCFLFLDEVFIRKFYARQPRIQHPQMCINTTKNNCFSENFAQNILLFFCANKIYSCI